MRREAPGFGAAHPRSEALGGLTARYLVRGGLAVIMGIGWLFGAVAAAMGLAVSDKLRTSRLGHTITSLCLLLFGLCFVYVAANSVVATYFPGLG